MNQNSYKDLNSTFSGDYRPAKGARVITALIEDAEDMAALEKELNKIPLPNRNSEEPTSLGKMFVGTAD